LVGEGANHKQVFDNVKSRFRRSGLKQDSVDKYLQSGIIGNTPLSLRIFDMLRFERKGLLHLPFDERTSYVESLDEPGIVPVDNELVHDAAELELVVESAFSDGHEGMVCKNPDSPYRPGSVTTTDWVKFKRSETLDLVVVGFYKSEEHSLDLPFTSVLVAAYNDATQTYETLGKVGVTRDGIAKEIDGKVRGRTRSQRPGKVAFSEKLDREAYAKFVPDSYIEPEQSVVLEVKAMNLYLSDNWQTCGLDNGKAFSMRIGWANQLRHDKDPHQATRTSAIAKLYQLQEGGVRQ
ncbi:hypothetical protein KY359_05795, partial [Candidatus Woesearchaeota archaeon]|nr:hypothetical protein [Candidatus Woesearchaeota archaeon]